MAGRSVDPEMLESRENISVSEAVVEVVSELTRSLPSAKPLRARNLL
jgi:hypothetical protein